MERDTTDQAEDLEHTGSDTADPAAEEEAPVTIINPDAEQPAAPGEDEEEPEPAEG